MANLQTTIDSLSLAPLVEELRVTLRDARSSHVRPISQWVEDEIVLPNGPYKGERYRHYRHPASRPWFAALDAGMWSRAAAVAPTQNGKTLMCYVLPILWHLFEHQETAIVGLPVMDMATDKWREDFLPVIEASQYRALLPTTGEGSRGGKVKSAIVFGNGATLRFMSGGGSDKKRAGYTARVLGVTETDGMDEASERSRESDKIEQLEGRTRAFGRTGKQVYLECTASIESGRIWQEVTGGTNSRLARPCPHCDQYVTPEREHLIGWEDARSEDEAAELAAFSCPSCGEAWTEEQRRDAWEHIVLVHGGQSVIDGEVIGEPPRTQTLGFRWSAVDNPMQTTADLGAEEWIAARKQHRENAERKMRQFVWALPAESPDVDLTPLEAEQIEQRGSGLKRGVVPRDCVGIAVGVDTGKRTLHWVAQAITQEGNGRIIEYGSVPVDSQTLGVHRGLIDAMSKLRSYLENGWRDEAGTLYVPSQVWIDSGYSEHTTAVYTFCAQANSALNLTAGAERYRPMKGYGENQRRMRPYKSPQAKNNDVRYVGTEYHIGRVRRAGKILPGVLLVHVNSDYWKSALHERLAMPSDEPLAVTLYESPTVSEHSELVDHLLAERQVETFVAGRGTVITWERERRNNHYLDATYTATCCGDFVLTQRTRQTSARETSRPTLSQLSGR